MFVGPGRFNSDSRYAQDQERPSRIARRPMRGRCRWSTGDSEGARLGSGLLCLVWRGAMGWRGAMRRGSLAAWWRVARRHAPRLVGGAWRFVGGRMAPPHLMRIGHHTSISGALENSALKAVELGANTFQIFRRARPVESLGTERPRHRALSARARKARSDAAVIHDNYLSTSHRRTKILAHCQLRRFA